MIKRKKENNTTHESSISWLGTWASIKCGGVKVVVSAKSSPSSWSSAVMQFFFTFSHVSEIPTLTVALF